MMSKLWLIVSGDFTPWGGMDRANHALASYLAGREGAEVHLVSHRVADDLATLPNVRVHGVRRPWGKHLLGAPLLAREGRRQALRLASRGARVVVNGGNCRWDDVNWVHYVHAAWQPPRDGSYGRRLKTWAERLSAPGRRIASSEMHAAGQAPHEFRENTRRRDQFPGHGARAGPHGPSRQRPGLVPAADPRRTRRSSRPAPLGGRRPTRHRLRRRAGRPAQGVRHPAGCLALAGAESLVGMPGSWSSARARRSTAGSSPPPT